MPLFGGRRAVWVKAGSRNFAAAVEAVVATPPTDCRIVIEAGDLKRNAPVRAICEKAKCAAVLPCYIDTERDLVRLVDDEMREAKLSIAPDARAALVSLIGGDRQASRSEIRKLALYAHGKERVTLDDVVAVVADASALALDAVVDAAFAGRAPETEAQFSKALSAGTSSGTIMSWALRYVTQLHKARVALDAGDDTYAAMRSFIPPIHFRREAKVQTALKAWTAPRLERAMEPTGGERRSTSGAPRRCRMRWRSAHCCSIASGRCLRAGETANPLQAAAELAASIVAPVAPAGGRHASISPCAVEHAAARTRACAFRRPVLSQQDRSSWSCRSVPAARPIVAARVVSQVVQSGLGQSVVIENRPGAGGATGTKSVAAADPDGYTMLIGTSATLGVVPALVKNPGYDPIKSFAPVAKISDSTTILIVPTNFPANSVAELVAYAKANPGKLSYSSAGYGNQTQLAAELLLARAGIKAVHVPYKSGAEMVTAVLSEQVQMTFPDVSILLPLIRRRRSRRSPSPARRGIRSFRTCRPWPRAASPDYVTTFWTGVIVPAGTPPDIVNKLNAAINDGLKSQLVHDSLGKAGAQPASGSPQDFGKFIADETRKWAAIAQTAGIAPQ